MYYYYYAFAVTLYLIKKKKPKTTIRSDIIILLLYIIQPVYVLPPSRPPYLSIIFYYFTPLDYYRQRSGKRAAAVAVNFMNFFSLRDDLRPRRVRATARRTDRAPVLYARSRYNLHYYNNIFYRFITISPSQRGQL